MFDLEIWVWFVRELLIKLHVKKCWLTMIAGALGPMSEGIQYNKLHFQEFHTFNQVVFVMEYYLHHGQPANQFKKKKYQVNSIQSKYLCLQILICHSNCVMRNFDWTWMNIKQNLYHWKLISLPMSLPWHMFFLTEFCEKSEKKLLLKI